MCLGNPIVYIVVIEVMTLKVTTNKNCIQPSFASIFCVIYGIVKQIAIITNPKAITSLIYAITGKSQYRRNNIKRMGIATVQRMIFAPKAISGG